jgi:hypothetical protein
LKHLADYEVWASTDEDDLWIFDKLILSRKLGHVCGPMGVYVPTPGNYVVRPCVNLYGMSRGASIEYIEHDTEHLPDGSFWQEVFSGTHYSVDYENGNQVRCTIGVLEDPAKSLSRFKLWKVDEKHITLPSIIQHFVDKYPAVNVEIIGDKVIEVHLRGNPDFEDGAVEIIPVWSDSQKETPSGYTFVHSPDGDRVGFFKRYR